MNSWVWNAARTAIVALAWVLCGTAWGQTTDFNTGTNGFVIDQSTSGSFSTTVQGWTVVVSTDPGATTTRVRLGTSTLTGAPSAGWIRGEGSAGLFNSLEFRSASQFDLDSIWTAATASTSIQPLNASYAPIGSAVAYSPGSSQTEINLSANTDFDGIYGFRIVPSDGNTLQPISQVTISNVGTPPTVTLAASPASMGETGGSSTVTATLSGTASTATTVNLAFSGTASGGGGDYTASNTSITIPSGSTTGSVTLSAVSDAIAEANETIIVDISSVSGGDGATESGTQQATVTITDDDSAAVTIADVSQAENGGAVTFTATLSAAVQNGFTVDVSTADGTATVADGDYTAVSGQTLTFAGTSGETQTFTITPGADTKVEADETVTISMSNLTGASGTVDISDTATLTLTNDDSAAVTIADVSADEDNGAITLTATLDNAVAGGFTVDVSSADGTATTADSDYTAISGQTLTFAGTASETQTFTLTPTSDTKLEANETVSVSMSNLAATALSVTITDTATVTFNNDDTAAVTITDASGDEDAGAVTFTATLSNAVQGGFTVDVSTNDGTATTADSDYTAVSGQTLTFTGTASETQTFTVTPTADSAIEAAETVNIAMSNLAGTSLGVDISDTATLTINNDDADATAPRVQSITRSNPATSPTSASTLDWAVAFNETVNNVDSTDFVVTGASVAPSITVLGSGATYTVRATGGSLSGMNGTVTLSFAPGQNIADTSANALSNTTPIGANDNTFLISNPTPPAFSLAFSPSSIAQGAASTLTYTLDNSANLVNATSLDFTNTLPANVIVAATPNAATTCTGGTLTAASGAGSISYSGGTVSASGSCTVSVDVTSSVAGAYTNTTGSLTSSLGNSGTASGGLTVTDGTLPTVTSITRLTPASETTDADAVTWRVVFSEPVVNVGAADFTVSGPSGASIGVTGSGGAYDVTVSGGDMASLNATITLNIAGGNDIADAASNALASTTPSGTDERTYIISNPGAPGFTAAFSPNTVAVGGTATLTFSINNGSNVVPATALGFSNALPSGLTLAAAPNASTTCTSGTLTATSGASSFSYNGGSVAASASCTLSVTVQTSSQGVFTNTSGALSSSLGASGGATASLTTTDATPPVLTAIERQSPAAALTNSDTLVFAISFSETVSNVTADDFTILGTTATGVLSGSGASYTLSLSGGDLASLNGAVSLSLAGGQDITDLAGNALTTAAPGANEIYTLDNTAPTVSLTRAANAPVAGPFTLTIAFSEAVSGLALDDLTVSNGAASDLAGSDEQYTVLITPTSDTDVSIALNAASANDAAGNPNLASDTLTVGVDAKAPVLTITLPGATTEGPFTARFTFDERVSGFEASDILVTNGSVSDFMIETDRSFTALITPATAGPVTVEVANTAASDQAGNGNEAAQAVIEAISGAEDVEIVIDQTTGDVTDIKAEVRIGNPGSQSLNFRVEVDVPWISVDPVSGVIPALGDILLNVQVLPEAADLPAGVYSGVITVVRDLPTSPLMRPSATGGAATESIIVEIPLTVTIEERFGSIQLVATTPGGVQRDATFLYASSDADLDGLQLTTIGGSAASASFEKEAGLYDVSQSAPEGWRLDEISCTGDLDGGSVITLSDGRVLIDLDPTEAITCTFSNTRDEDAVRLATQRAINNFMVRRADRILAAAPDLSQRLQERQSDTPGQFSAHVEGDRKALSLSTSLSGVRNHVQASQPQMTDGPRLDQQERPNLDVWMRAEFSAISDDRDGGDASSDFGLLQIGADWTLGENALVGVMVQRDWMDETSAEIAQSVGALRGARVQGHGWMAGPYLAWGLSDSAWLDVLAMWGQSQNTVDPLGLYEDEFDTDRLMIRANLTGEWQSANWRVRPSISLAHFEETQGGYTDSLGIEIPEQTIRIGRLQAGPEVSYRFERRNGSWWEPGLSLNGVWDYDPAALMDELGQRISTGALRADAGLSLRARLSDGAMLSGEVRLDGLGDGDFSANSGRLEIRLPF